MPTELKEIFLAGKNSLNNNFEYLSLELEMRMIIFVLFSVLLDPLPGVEECGNSPEQDFTFRIAGNYLNFSRDVYTYFTYFNEKVII